LSGEGAGGLLLRGFTRRRPGPGRRALFDKPLFEEGVDVGLPEESPSAELHEGQVALGHQLEEKTSAYSEIIKDVGEAQDLPLGFHAPDFIRSTPANQRKNHLTQGLKRTYINLYRLGWRYKGRYEPQRIRAEASALDLQDVRLSLPFGHVAGAEDLVRWSHVPLRALSAGRAEGRRFRREKRECRKRDASISSLWLRAGLARPSTSTGSAKTLTAQSTSATASPRIMSFDRTAGFIGPETALRDASSSVSVREGRKG
jgi:hypothetical protein